MVLDRWLDHKVGSFKASRIFIFPLLSVPLQHQLWTYPAEDNTSRQTEGQIVGQLELLFMGHVRGWEG